MIEAIEICEKVAGRSLQWTYSETNRIGDHKWWISDYSAFATDYPGLVASLRPPRHPRRHLRQQRRAMESGRVVTHPRYPVLGVQITAIERPEAADAVMARPGIGIPLGVSALAVHGVMEGVFDPEVQYRLNDLEMVVADGQPVRWALQWLHGVGLAGAGLWTRPDE